MPSWMPGEDYYTDFHKGDPYVKVDQGFARLPGAGYAALHPELEDVNPEDYPDIHKMAILADVAPYSREYNTFRLKVGNQARDNTELQIEYEKILERVRQTRVGHKDAGPGLPILPNNKNLARARTKPRVAYCSCCAGRLFPRIAVCEQYLYYGESGTPPVSLFALPVLCHNKTSRMREPSPGAGPAAFLLGSTDLFTRADSASEAHSFGGAIVLGTFVRESRGNMGFPKMS